LVIERPSGLLVELGYYLMELKERLGQKDHTKKLKYESSNQLHRVSVATLVLARIGGNPLNYSLIKAKASMLLEELLALLEELFSLVRWQGFGRDLAGTS